MVANPPIPTQRGSIRKELDTLIVRCPVRICGHGETADYGFIVDDLSPIEINRLSALLSKLAHHKGEIITNDNREKELRFSFDSVGDYMYFGIEIEPHPTLGHPQLQGQLPMEMELAQAWNDPGTPYYHNNSARPLERY